MTVTPGQRHSRRNPCRVCGGHAGLPAGKGERCAGFLSEDGEYEHCQREEYAGKLALNEKTTPPTYAHKLHGDCLCGVLHGPAAHSSVLQLPPRLTRYELRHSDETLAGIHVRKDYLDSDGRPYRDKEMWWEQHNGRGAAEMPLYNLLADRRHRTDALRIICEGEKATDVLNAALKRARRTDMIAVGTVTGAPGFPCDASLTRYLGYPVALWPDNDEVGRKQMTSIAARLVALGAMPPEWVNWKDAPPKGDAADYFAAGGTVAQLDAMMSKVAPTQSAEQPKMPTDAKMPKESHRETKGTLVRGGHLSTVNLADVEPEQVKWLWQGYIPLGKVTVLDGDPGLGKSLLTLDLAARVTTGRDMPDGTPGVCGGVILLSAEDDLADTIRPRLDAAGADVAKVTALEAVGDVDVETGEVHERPVYLPQDIPAVCQAIQEHGAVLAIIDPLMAFLDGDVNAHRDQDIRRALRPLAQCAQETGAAVVVIRHLNKAPGGKAIYRGGGSIGIAGAARSALLVAEDPDDENKRVLARVKSNLAAPVPALGYQLAQNADGVVSIEWLGVAAHTATSLLATATVDPEERSATEECADWLQDQLDTNGGWVAAKDAQHEAHAAGFTEKVLRSARLRLCERPTKEGFGGAGQWVWRVRPSPTGPAAKMPSEPKMPNNAYTENEGTLGDGGHLSADVRNECDRSATAPDNEAKTVRADGEGIDTSHRTDSFEQEPLTHQNGHQPAGGRPCLRCGGWLAPHPLGGWLPCAQCAVTTGGVSS